MITNNSPTAIGPSSTVQDILDDWPQALQLFQEYQTGTEGICVITRSDSLQELCSRFDLTVNRVIEDIQSLNQSPNR